MFHKRSVDDILITDLILVLMSFYILMNSHYSYIGVLLLYIYVVNNVSDMKGFLNGDEVMV